MSADPARSALLRVARECGLDPDQHPEHLATGIIRRMQKQSELITRYEITIATAHKRLEIMGEPLA